MSAALGLVIGFAVLGTLLALKRPIWLVLLVSSIVMGIISLGPIGLADVIYKTVISSATIDLLVITGLIMILVGLYRYSEFVNIIGKEMNKLAGNPKISIAIVPAVLGLLPVPGGALLSAPIVESAGESLGLSKERKVFLNVWFRHVVFLIYPLSTTLIIASTLMETSIWVMLMWLLPVAAVMIASGFLVGYPRGVSAKDTGGRAKADIMLLIKSLAPVLIAIATALSLSPILDYKYPFPIRRISMVIAVTLGIVLLFILAGLSKKEFLQSIRDRSMWEIVLAAFGAVLLGRVVVEIGGSALIGSLLTGLGINKAALLISIPFMLSFIAGTLHNGIILSVPILEQLIVPGTVDPAVIYASAFVGYTISPLHLCYVFSADYFKIPMIRVYRYMIPAAIITLVTAILLSLTV
jgi:hypothetical protein